MATNKAEPDDKVFDITKPGKSTASASSRPLIVGHKPMLKDPMVKNKAVDVLEEGKSVKIDQPIEDDLPSGSPPLPAREKIAGSSEKKSSSPSESRFSLKPFGDNKSKAKEKSSNNAAAVPVKVNKTDDKVSAAAISTPTTAPKIDKAALARESSMANEPNDTVASETSADDVKKKTKKDAGEAASKNSEIEKLVESKKYFVPVGKNASKKRSSRRIIMWSLIGLLLGLALIYLMIDVGIIKTNIKLPFEFFKDSDVSTTTPAITPSTNKSETNSNSIYKDWKTYEDKSGNFVVKYPAEWKIKTSTNKQGDLTTVQTTITSATGTVVNLNTDAGGKGGQCEPRKTDEAFKTGNLCPSWEYLSQEVLNVKNVYYTKSTASGDEVKFDTLPAKVYLVTKHFATPEGKSSYVIGVTAKDEAPDLTLNKPMMGFNFDFEQFYNTNSKGESKYYIYAYAIKPDKSFLTSKDAEVVKNIFRSMTVKN